MKGTELHAELHLAAFALADVMAEHAVSLAHVAALRRRIEGALQRAREHVLPAPRYIEDLRGFVVCED